MVSPELRFSGPQVKVAGSWIHTVCSRARRCPIKNPSKTSSWCPASPVLSFYRVCIYTLARPRLPRLTAPHTDRQIHLYTLPTLDPAPFKPIRNVLTFAVDQQHLRRPPQSFPTPAAALDPVDFCVVKRTGLTLFSLREKLVALKVNVRSPDRRTPRI